MLARSYVPQTGSLRHYSFFKYLSSKSNSPSSGGCLFRSTARMSSSVTSSLEKSPPCITSTRLLMQWASGNQLYTSVNRSAICDVYFDVTSPRKPYMRFMSRVSWFPGKKIKQFTSSNPRALLGFISTNEYYC